VYVVGGGNCLWVLLEVLIYVFNNLGLLSICYVFGCGVDLCLCHLGFVNSSGSMKWNGLRVFCILDSCLKMTLRDNIKNN
jgi:hypothetical protein